jgi:tetrahydromethanopterin S-methyltransferase subunit E
VSRYTVRQVAGATVRYTVVCGIAALVADIVALPFHGQEWTAAWLSAMVPAAFLLSVLADALTGRRGGRS